MPTNTEQLLTDFRAELNKLKPAVELVDEMSAYVILVKERADAIHSEAGRLLKELEMVSKKNMEDSQKALEDFRDLTIKTVQELEEISKRLIGDFERKAEKEFSQFVQKAEDTLKQIQESANQLLVTIQREMEALALRIDTMLEEKVNALKESIERLIQNLPGLIERLSKLTDFLERSDLPERLRRLEDSLVTLNTSVQNLHGRLDFMELNLREEHRKGQGMVEAVRDQVKGIRTGMILFFVVNLLLMLGMFVMLYLKIKN